MTPRRKLLWKLFPYYLLLSLITVFCVILITDSSLNPQRFILCLTVATGAALVNFAFIWRINRTLEKTREGARRFADGDLDFRLDVPQSEELGSLAETLNQMAAQLDERISTINRQRSEQDAILGSMVEGVIAVDTSSSILLVNQAATRFIDTQTESLIGRSLHEVIRNRNMQQLVDRALEDGTPTEGEIVLYGPTERSMQIHCTALHSTDGDNIGALIVLNDITRLRRLERVRRDFVANVSHELKTPLTSIKGFVETLLDGALEQPEEARRFCTIISKQVERLQAIIEDLLSLSRIEQEVERGQIDLKPNRISDVLISAVQCVELQAAEKNIRVKVDCQPDYVAEINPPLFEQVAVNLIDNAIKYSDPGKEVFIKTIPSEAFWEISFTDLGCGIDPANINRIFERFYRVDKARSRKVGGTGLGLAIVKHIVTAHGGKVTVESKPAQGSTFTVFIPLKRELAPFSHAENSH